MKFANFKLQQPSVTTELIGLGFHWDLHNFAEFVGLEFYPKSDEVILAWTIPSGVSNPWSSQANTNKACKLIFRKVKFLMLSERDEKISQIASQSLESISKIDPHSSKYPHKTAWRENDEFHLLFEFSDGRKIQIHSETVELQAS